MADTTSHSSDVRPLKTSERVILKPVIIKLPPIKEVAEDSDSSRKMEEKDRDVQVVETIPPNNTLEHKSNTHASTIYSKTRSHYPDTSVLAIEIFNRRHPNLLFPSDSMSQSQASSSQVSSIQVQAQVAQQGKKAEPANVFLMTAPQDVPKVVDTAAYELKAANIWLELFALDIDIGATIREELQKASVLVQQFHCMHLLRTYERNNPPRQQTLRIYLINPTAYAMLTNRTYFGEKAEQLCRVIAPCDMESRCCFFSKPIIHNPIDPYSNTEINIFLSDRADLNFTSISTVFATCKHKLLTQLANLNVSAETKSFVKM